MSIYLDHAATSFPKPAAVAKAVQNYMLNNGANIGRGGYDEAYEAEESLINLREEIAALFGADDPSCVILTPGITYSLNMVLKGLLGEGDGLIISSMEHNAVARVAEELKKKGTSVSIMQCDEKGELNLSDEEIKALIAPGVKAMAVTAASNVTGTHLPLKRLGNICRQNDIIFIVDSAQAAGEYPININELNIDILCFSGHKGLLGPQGTGGFIIKQELAWKIKPLILGGTGSFSDILTMPDILPDRFEAGTLNLPGFMGLLEGVRYIRSRDFDAYISHERILTQTFIDGLKAYEEDGLIRICGKRDTKNRCALVSFETLDTDLASLAYLLDNRYHIKVRAGLHCAPLAHRTIGTYPTGTIRFSFGESNTQDEINTALFAIGEILNDKRNVKGE